MAKSNYEEITEELMEILPRYAINNDFINRELDFYTESTKIEDKRIEDCENGYCPYCVNRLVIKRGYPKSLGCRSNGTIDECYFKGAIDPMRFVHFNRRYGDRNEVILPFPDVVMSR